MKYLTGFMLVVVMVLGSCDEECCETELPTSTGGGSQDQITYERTVAEKFAPVLVFDQDQGVQDGKEG